MKINRIYGLRKPYSTADAYKHVRIILSEVLEENGTILDRVLHAKRKDAKAQEMKKKVIRDYNKKMIESHSAYAYNGLYACIFQMNSSSIAQIINET